MHLYYYFFLIIALSLIILFIRALFLQKEDISDKLFVEALRDENNGHFEEAIITYGNALIEVKKRKFQSSLKNRIVEKLKVLHTAIDYQKGFYFISRLNN